jgi:hypothetical protein
MENLTFVCPTRRVTYAKPYSIERLAFQMKHQIPNRLMQSRADINALIPTRPTQDWFLIETSEDHADHKKI